MAKNKKTNNANQKLSPENYIRQKARSLPIYECWITSNWKNSGLASICISRIHSNGNLTLGMYLVDLYCLGLKDTTYRFNFFRSDYNELIDDMKEKQEMTKIDYPLAHNIIFAGIEYADELGFKPPKEFTSVTQYILEEDNDDIELIEIECGHDGEPFYIKSENTSIAQFHSILNTLNKSVGEGNYKIFINDSMDDLFDDDDEYDDDEQDDVLMNEYNKLSKHGRIELFKQLTVNGIDDISEEKTFQLVALTDSIFFMDLCDSEEVNKIYDSWVADLNVNIGEKYYTWESLGLESEREISDEDKTDFMGLDLLLNTKSKKLKNRIEEMRKKWGNIPYIDVIELHYLKETNPKLFESKLIEYDSKLANYSFFKMLKFKNNYFKNNDQKTFENMIDLDSIFDGRESITPKEIIIYFTNKILALQVRNNKNELEAMEMILEDISLEEEITNTLKMFLIITKIESLMRDLNE